MSKYNFYNTGRWRKLRQYVIDRAGGLCEVCHIEKGTIADHIIEVSNYNVNDPNIVWNPDNLQAVCDGCHNRKHHGNGGACADGLMFDGDGNLIQIGE